MKKLLNASLLAFIATLIHLVILISPLGDSTESRLVDLWGSVRGKLPPPSSVAIVAMDEQSFDLLGLKMDQAWPRALHGQLLAKLKELGAKRVVFDIIFKDAGNKEADETLADGIKGVPTVLGEDIGTQARNSSVGNYSFEELIEPYSKFADNAETLALVRVPEDNGFVRRFYAPRTKFTQNIPTLFEAAAGVKPTDSGLPGMRDFISFYGPPDTIEAFPYHQVLNPKDPLPKNFFKDKVIFVGLFLRTEVGPALKDTYRASSFHPRNMFGIEIHATAAANIMAKKWISRTSPFVECLVLLIFTFAATLGIFLLRPLYAGLLTVGIAVVWPLTSYIGYSSGIFIPGVWLVALIIPLSFLGNTLVYYVVTLRSQQQVEKAFQFYLSPDMAKAMKQNPKGLELGGESVYATALFTDIEGFTRITESMIASEVSQMLNSYFTEVMEVVFENKGTLIKFIGDAVFVIWGAPLKVEDHAKRACRTALAIAKEVEKFNASKRFPALHTRVGLNTGNMVVGNLGSSKRFDYTAIGDSVNLASRVEGINKYLGTTVIITETTKKEMGGEFPTVPMGAIQVVGKSEVVPIFTLFETALSEENSLVWQKALLDFRTKKFSDARAAFESVKGLEPRLKKACEVYISEIARHEATPPSAEWRGEISFDMK